MPDRARADAGRMRDAASRVSQTGREPTERGAGDSDPHCPRPRPRRCAGSGDRGRDSVKRNRMAQTGLLDRTACRTLMGAALAMLLAMPYVTPRSLLDRSGAVRHRYRRRATTSPPLSPSARGMSCPLASMTDALRVAVSIYRQTHRIRGNRQRIRYLVHPHQNEGRIRFIRHRVHARAAVVRAPVRRRIQRRRLAAAPVAHGRRQRELRPGIRRAVVHRGGIDHQVGVAGRSGRGRGGTTAGRTEVRRVMRRARAIRGWWRCTSPAGC